MDFGPDEDTSGMSSDMKNRANSARADRIKSKKNELAHVSEVINRKVKIDAYRRLMASLDIELATESQALETIKSATPLVTQEAAKIISLFPLGLINAEGDSGTPQNSLNRGLRTDAYANRKLVVKINTKQGRAHAQWIPHMSRWSSTTGIMEEGGEYTQLKLNKMPSVDGPDYPRWRSTLVHELGHSLENANPQLKMWEYAFWTHRRKGERLQKLKKLLGGRYGSSEVAIKDDWPNAYSGKYYGRRMGLPEQENFEILSTGLERLLGNKSWNDPEYEAFIVGILMLANRLEVAWEKPESLPEPPESPNPVRFNRE